MSKEPKYKIELMHYEAHVKNGITHMHFRLNSADPVVIAGALHAMCTDITPDTVPKPETNPAHEEIHEEKPDIHAEKQVMTYHGDAEDYLSEKGLIKKPKRKATHGEEWRECELDVLCGCSSVKEAINKYRACNFPQSRTDKAVENMFYRLKRSRKLNFQRPALKLGHKVIAMFPEGKKIGKVTKTGVDDNGNKTALVTSGQSTVWVLQSDLKFPGVS